MKIFFICAFEKLPDSKVGGVKLCAETIEVARQEAVLLARKLKDRGRHVHGKITKWLLLTDDVTEDFDGSPLDNDDAKSLNNLSIPVADLDDFRILGGKQAGSQRIGPWPVGRIVGPLVDN